MEVARLLRELRQEAGLTLAAVAERAGIGVNTVSALELGTRSTRAVGVSVAYRLAQALGVDPARLMIAMGSGDTQATQERELSASLDVTSVPVADFPPEQTITWDPWKAASPHVRYAVPRSVTAARPGGVAVRWSTGVPAPVVSVSARSYLGRMAPGWVGYLSPTPMLEDFSDDGEYAEYPDLLDTLSHVGIALVAWPENLALVTISEVEQDRRHDSGFDLEGMRPVKPEDQNVIGRVTWWASR